MSLELANCFTRSSRLLDNGKRRWNTAIDTYVYTYVLDWLLLTATDPSLSSSFFAEKMTEKIATVDVAEHMRTYRLLHEEVLWPFFEMKERIASTQRRAVKVSDLVEEGMFCYGTAPKPA